MPNYTTVELFIGRFESPQAVAVMTGLTEDSAPDPDLLRSVLDEVEGEINSYLAQRYSVPVVSPDAQVAAVLRARVHDIAEYRLCTHGDLASEERKDRWQSALDWLMKIADGKLDLPGATPLPPSVTSWAITYASQERVFTRETTSGL